MNQQHKVCYKNASEGITIYNTPNGYLFTTVYNGTKLARVFTKDSAHYHNQLEEIIKNRFDIENDIILAYH